MKIPPRARQLVDLAVQAALTDPASAKAMLQEAAELAPANRKSARAEVLSQSFRRAAAVAEALGWKGALVVRDGRLLVEQDGVLFHAEGGNHFFRTDGPSMAKPMRRKLKALGLPVRTVFDLGANVGEVAISFAAAYPNARVLAFEPAPENLARLAANIALQPERLSNLTVVPEAVSDRTGQIAFTAGAERLNTLVLDDANLHRLERVPGVTVTNVPTDTLEGFCSRFGVDEIDFLKVDIEGGEPLLSASVRSMGGRIRSALVEVSRYGQLDSYLELVDAFASSGLALYDFDEDEQVVGDPAGYIAGCLETRPSINVWFLPRRTTTPA